MNKMITNNKRCSIIYFLIFLVFIMSGAIQFIAKYLGDNFGESYAFAFICFICLYLVAIGIDPIFKKLILPTYRFLKKLWKGFRDVPFIINLNIKKVTIKVRNPFYKREPLFAMSFLEEVARKREKKEKPQRMYDELLERAFGKNYKKK